jgi:hypothetical protein
VDITCWQEEVSPLLYLQVCSLFLLLLKGERSEREEGDDAKALEQCEAIHAEVAKGIFSSLDAKVCCRAVWRVLMPWLRR